MYKEIKKFEELKHIQKLEFINLGTGMGYYDFRYEDFPVNAFNFSLLRQNLYFDYQLLKKYSYFLEKNCTVCIVLPYFIFCADRLRDALPQYARYYFLLPKEEVEPYCTISYESWSITDKKISSEDDSLKHALEEDEMVRQSQEALENWKTQLQIISYDSGEISKHTKNEIENSQNWLKLILDYCEKMQFEPVIIVPPMSRTLLEKIGMGFRRLNFYDILKKVVPEDIQILDYSENDFFCNPKLYGWPGFLTEKGAKMFTRDVFEKLGFIAKMEGNKQEC